MEQILYLFNPDNELALADGGTDYLPPASAKKMEEDLSFLPVWWAEKDSSILVSSIALAQRWQMKYIELIPSVKFTSFSLIPEFTQIKPWGWNCTLRKKLLKWGISINNLPSDKQLKEIRRLSNRATAVKCLLELNKISYTCGDSFICYTEEEIFSLLKKNKPFIMKAPWSGSGKGLRRGNGIDNISLSNWCKKILRNQGSMVIEPYYNKVQDFAMEFFLQEDGSFLWLGYSLFRTDENGSYKSNLLMDNRRIEELLSNYVPEIDWCNFRDRLIKLLGKHLGTNYTGYIGVDMMVVCSKDELKYYIHPCVEINLRMNMGIVSRLFYDRYVEFGSKGLFSVNYFSSSEKLNTWHEEQKEKKPLHIKGGRISSGYFSLVPVGKETRYLVSVFIS